MPTERTEPVAFLIGINDELVDRSFPLRDGMTLGRDVNADLFLPDISLNREHAIVRRTDDGFWSIHELETSIERTLKMGEILTFGRFAFRVSSSEAAKNIHPSSILEFSRDPRPKDRSLYEYRLHLIVESNMAAKRTIDLSEIPTITDRTIERFRHTHDSLPIYASYRSNGSPTCIHLPQSVEREIDRREVLLLARKWSTELTVSDAAGNDPRFAVAIETSVYIDAGEQEESQPGPKFGFDVYPYEILFKVNAAANESLDPSLALRRRNPAIRSYDTKGIDGVTNDETWYRWIATQNCGSGRRWKAMASFPLPLESLLEATPFGRIDTQVRRMVRDPRTSVLHIDVIHKSPTIEGSVYRSVDSVNAVDWRCVSSRIMETGGYRSRLQSNVLPRELCVHLDRCMQNAEPFQTGNRSAGDVIHSKIANKSRRAA